MDNQNTLSQADIYFRSGFVLILVLMDNQNTRLVPLGRKPLLVLILVLMDNQNTEWTPLSEDARLS